MTDHVQKAQELFTRGASCSQAVFAAFCDVTGMDEQAALKMSAPFGGGFGRMREVCGAVSGMCLAAGCLFGYSDLQDAEAKKKHYALIASLMKEFETQNGSYICRRLLGLEPSAPYSPEAQPRTKEFYQKRPCVECVKSAAAILEAQLNK